MSNTQSGERTDITSKLHVFDCRYLRMAAVWAGNSYCKRSQVGALLVRDRMIISDGYNGTPSGFPNVCEGPDGLTLPYVLHAEANAISKVARSNNSSEGATLYVTVSPCMECAKLIIQAGIARVVYMEQYRKQDGIDLLKRAGIPVEWIPLEDVNRTLSEAAPCTSTPNSPTPKGNEAR